MNVIAKGVLDQGRRLETINRSDPIYVSCTYICKY